MLKSNTILSGVARRIPRQRILCGDRNMAGVSITLNIKRSFVDQKRGVSFSAMEKVVGQYAANTFIESMNLNSKSIVRLFLIIECGVVGSYIISILFNYS